MDEANPIQVYATELKSDDKEQTGLFAKQHSESRLVSDTN